MIVVPTATAVTSPWAVTVATPAFPELQATARPFNVPPFASSVIAVARDVPTAVIEFGERATVTDATGTGTTVIDEVPFFPSLVAVIVALPTDAAVTTPTLLTVAIAGLLEDQITTRSVTTTLFASRVAAESCWVAPAMIVAEGGLTVTEATGTGVTVMIALPDFPSLVAIIVVTPAATAVTSPADETVATASFPLLHVTTRPERMLLLASKVVAVAWLVWPA
jgi:hypothetical protein